jgi:hypothetical protein
MAINYDYGNRNEYEDSAPIYYGDVSNPSIDYVAPVVQPEVTSPLSTVQTADTAPTTPTGGLSVTQDVSTGTTPNNQLSGVILAGDSWLAGDEKTNLANQAFGQNVTNTAVGGQKTSDVLNQLNVFERDGGTFAPNSTVVLDVGANDIATGVDKNTIRNNIDEIVSRLEAKGVNVVLSGAPTANSYADAISRTDLKMDDLYNDVAKNHSNVVLVDAMSGLLNQKDLMDASGFHLKDDASKTVFLNQLADAYKGLSPTAQAVIDDKLATVNPNDLVAVAKVVDSVAGTNIASNTAEAPVGGLPTTQATNQSAIDNLSKQILASSNTSVWQGEGFGSAEKNAADMAKILSGIGITDIKDFGQIKKEVPTYSYDQDGNATQTGTETVTTYGNKKTGQEVPQTYGERQTGNAFGGTYAGKGNTAYRAQFDANGNPIFYTTGASSSNIGDFAPLLAAASFIPGVAPFAMAANAAIAIDRGDIIGGLASLAGLGGYTDVATGLRVTNALKNGDTSGLIMSLMQNPTVSNAAGSTMLTDTISLRDASNALNVANNVSTGNYAGALSSAGMLTGSKDVTTAGAALRVVNAINSGNETAIINALGGLNNTMHYQTKTCARICKCRTEYWHIIFVSKLN